MHKLLLIGSGGFLGAIFRYLTSSLVQNKDSLFPMGTLSVNFIGSFFIGIIMYLSKYKEFFTEETRIFLTVGLLGAFTTMSAFSYESFKLVEQNEFLLLGINIIGTIAVTLGAIYLSKILILNLWAA